MKRHGLTWVCGVAVLGLSACGGGADLAAVAEAIAEEARANESIEDGAFDAKYAQSELLAESVSTYDLTRVYDLPTSGSAGYDGAYLVESGELGMIFCRRSKTGRRFRGCDRDRSGA